MVIEIKKFRKPDHEISSMIVERWSPRAMSGEAISESELLSLFEAARWAPSSSNLQPWRFLYSRKGDEHWDTYFGLLAEGNQVWAKNAAVLILIVSKKTGHKDRPNRTHSFDAGSAWENLALQGSMMGLVVHAMAGFDYERAREELEIPEEYQIEAMVAVGKPGHQCSRSPRRPLRRKAPRPSRTSTSP